MLTAGWIPSVVQLLAALLVIGTVVRRPIRWLSTWVPAALTLGALLAAGTRWYVADQGLADDPLPIALWGWITTLGATCVLAALGWRQNARWRRAASLLAVPACVLCVALTLNAAVGYFPTLVSVLDRINGARQMDAATGTDLQLQGKAPNWNNIVKVTTPDDISGFRHRTELVMLPPAWHRSSPPPKLPVVIMLGGEFGTPADWLYAGKAQLALQAYADAHDGNAPLLVFPDYTGEFSNDTECVNGRRGNAADHLTKEFVPYIISHFGASEDPDQWGVVGWSSGGTCAITLAATQPELFHAFVDIDGQFGPNAGTKRQTIARLFGGDASAWAAFDPRTVIRSHPRYDGTAVWFAVSTNTPAVYRAPRPTTQPPDPTADTDVTASEDHGQIANELCSLASSRGFECAVVPNPSGHDFASASASFTQALPWLAARLRTPTTSPIPLPGAPDK
jgi:S-formylglutathione hydrolase FrmB